MEQTSTDPKQQAILEAAWHAFATYGFRKTSMDDIAQRAGMSRPALYQHYKNKNDIFRSLAQHYYDAAARDVSDALNGEGELHSRIEAAFAAQGGKVAEAMLTSAHGRELLETGGVAAADIVERGEARLTLVYAQWLADQAARRAIRLSGQSTDVAATLTAALKGIKSAAPDYATYRKQVAELARIVAAGLAPVW